MEAAAAVEAKDLSSFSDDDEVAIEGSDEGKSNCANNGKRT